MPRPHRGRRIGCNPGVTFFKPAGVPIAALGINTVHLDELESMRLVDAEGLHQAQAAERMGVSQSTVARLLEMGRRKVANALANGKALEIQRGPAPISFPPPPSAPGSSTRRGGGSRRRGGHGRGGL